MFSEESIEKGNILYPPPPPRNSRPPYDVAPIDVKTPFLDVLALEREVSGGVFYCGGGGGVY